MAKRDKLFLPQTHPRLLEEWDYHKNRVLGLDPNKLTYGSGKKAAWICLVCRYKWRSTIKNRSIKKTGCHVCRGQVPSDKTRFSINYPELCAEWHPTKNKFGPEKVSYGSGIKVWWLCSKCNWEWPSDIKNRCNNKQGCPACSGNVISDKNRLSLYYPGLCKEWNYVRNVKLNPEDVSYGSDKKVWWICSKGHEWRACISSRTSTGCGCSRCACGIVSKISQEWLDSLGIPQEYREFPITVGVKTYKVDGFDPATGEISEFLGDLWHGNPAIFSAGEINPVNKKSFGELHDQTFARFVELEKAGYKVVYVWESDYKNGIMISGRF